MYETFFNKNKYLEEGIEEGWLLLGLSATFIRT